jgi:hypothetical protein
MAKKLKLPKKRVEKILKRVEEEPTLADDYRIIREVFEDAIRIGLVKIKK